MHIVLILCNFIRLFVSKFGICMCDANMPPTPTCTKGCDLPNKDINEPSPMKCLSFIYKYYVSWLPPVC